MTNDPLIRAEDLILDVIRPTLKMMDGHYWSPAAERLLFMIAAHESMGFRHRRQINGPALSLWQIEPATYQDLWATYLDAHAIDRGGLMRRLMSVLLTKTEQADPEAALETNDYWACAVARMILARVPDPFPPVSQPAALAAYAKQHWNTVEGKATAEKYLHDAETHGPVFLPDLWKRSA